MTNPQADVIASIRHRIETQLVVEANANDGSYESCSLRVPMTVAEARQLLAVLSSPPSSGQEQEPEQKDTRVDSRK